MRMNQANHGQSEVKPRVSVVHDSVNQMKSAKRAYGPKAEPDWAGFLQEAGVAGIVTAAVAVVNNGVRPDLWNRLKNFGYSIVRCTDAPDCDELVIAEVVRTCLAADVVVIGGGDHAYTNIALVLRQMGKRVIVAAVSGSVSRELLAAADQFVEFPVIFTPEFPAEQGVPCAA